MSGFMFTLLLLFAEKSHTVIDGLVNQAGIMCNPFELSEDGYEMHLQVNYLGHFLLTALLLPSIQKSTQGRIVNVSAMYASTFPCPLKRVFLLFIILPYYRYCQCLSIG